MDRSLGLAYHNWPFGVLYPAIPYRTIAEQELEVGGMADGGFYRGGSDPLCVIYWSTNGYSGPDPKPARNRGLLQLLLQSGSVRHISCRAWRRGLIAVCAFASCHRGRTPADEVVCLRC